MNTAVEAIENPFASARVAAAPIGGTGMIAAQSMREMAEVQAAMQNARHFPRVEVEVMDRILQACTRPSLAEGALYEYARGGTDIRGPSIRLAECIAQQWGHIDYGWRVLEERPGVTKVQTFAWDLQTGTRSQVVFDVLHERVARGSKQTISDPRDVYEHIANAASRRLRACMLRVIPGDVVEAAVRQCEKTLATKVEVTPDLIADMLAQFAELGVPKSAIEKRIQRRVDAMTPGMMVQLRKIFTSLRDGMSSPGDWFEQGGQPVPEAAQAKPGGDARQTGTAAVKERLGARKAPSQATPAPAQEPEPLPPIGTTPIQSDALRDVIKFAKAAASQDDIDRAAAIAMTLTEEIEILQAQDHLDSARARLGVTL